MDYKLLASRLFPDVTDTPEDLEARFPARALPEGAGYAGGIMSAAVDGLRVAQKICEE